MFYYKDNTIYFIDASCYDAIFFALLVTEFNLPGKINHSGFGVGNTGRFDTHVIVNKFVFVRTWYGLGTVLILPKGNGINGLWGGMRVYAVVFWQVSGRGLYLPKRSVKPEEYLNTVALE